MNRKPNTSSGAAAALRRLAEARLRKHDRHRRPKASQTKLALDVRRLPHELQVHQVELEMQNAELQEARDRMEVQLEKYTDLYDFAPVGYFSLDEQGRVLEVNLTGAALLEVERSRLLNQSFLPLVVPASQPAFLAFLERLFAGTGKQVCEAELRRGHDAPFWAKFDGTAALSLNAAQKWCRVAISDITALKRAEDILRRNEALFAALIEQAPVGVYVADGQLVIRQVNPKARPTFSHVHPLRGRNLGEVMHMLWPGKIADEILGHFRHTLKTGDPYYSADFCERRRDVGLLESYEWQLQRITLPDGQHGVACFSDNITERKRAEATRRRNEVLAASNRKLEREIVRRQAVEQALRQSERRQTRLLKQSQQMQEQLRRLSRRILLAQEDERKRVSRELHDIISQTLTGISLHLGTLRAKANGKARGLQRSIARTQLMVEQSVHTIHRFARALRPAALDDLGLIPALRAFMKGFKEETGIHVSLLAFAAVEQVTNDKRTVLYRVAQEALSNVARHARASRVEVNIQKQDGAVCMRITDDGKGFRAEHVLDAKTQRRLGLLGMKERVEMVGGSLTVESTPGKGTTICVGMPFDSGSTGGGGGS